MVLTLFRDVAVDVCRVLPFPLSLVAPLGCGTSVSVLFLALFFKAREQVAKLINKVDKDGDGVVDEGTRAAKLFAMWPFRFGCWVAMCFFVIVQAMLFGPGDEAVTARVVKSLVAQGEFVLSFLGGGRFGRNRRFLLPLSALVVALKGVVQSLAASAPFTAWCGLFVATCAPFDLLSPNVEAWIKTAINFPLEFLKSCLFGRSKKAPEGLKDILPAKTTPTAVTVALFASWVSLGIYLDQGRTFGGALFDLLRKQ